MYIGVTFLTFRKSRNIPLLKDTLIVSLNGSENSVLNSFNIYAGMLLGPIALFGLMQLKQNFNASKVYVSAGVVRERKIIINLAGIM